MQQEMLEKLKQKTKTIVNEMQNNKLAKYLECIDRRNNSSFNVLTSPQLEDKDKILLVVSGIPEEAGVWSYTLLSQNRQEETSMMNYFKMVKKINWGIAILNPHGRGKIGDKEEYFYQLKLILESKFLKKTKKIILLCFSAGGSVAIEFLNNNPHFIKKISGIILMDTTPPPLSSRMIIPEVKEILKKTILYGLIDEKNKISSYAEITSNLLGLKLIPVKGTIHGEVPHLLLKSTEKYLVNL